MLFRGLAAPAQKVKVWVQSLAAEGGQRRSSKYVYESTTFHKEGLMGDIECQKPHSIKLVDIHLQICIESIGTQNLPQHCTSGQ